MDAISYSYADKQAKRIKKFINEPDLVSGIITVPKTIASGETVTIPAGRVAVLPNVQVDGILNINGEVFVPSGATFGDLEDQLALKAPLSSPVFTGNPTAPTPTAGDNSTKLATTAYVDGKMVLSTAVTASGTAIDFTSIPSWVKRITIMFNGVSLNSTSSLLIQIGDSDGIENTGYTATTIAQNSSGGYGGFSSTVGFPIFTTGASANFSGVARLLNLTSNTWIFESNGKVSATEMVSGAGNKDLSTKLDRVRITTVNGTDTFDSGQINIMYEG